MTETTTVESFAVDMADNTERHYDPDGRGRNHRTEVVRVN